MAANDRQRRGESPRYDDDEELLRITADYAEAARAGQAPRIADYVRRYPHYARELIAYALQFSAVAADQPAPEGRPAATLSPAAQKVLTYVREQHAAYETAEMAAAASPGTAPAVAPAPAPAEAFDSLLGRGVAVGVAPARLFGDLGLSADLGAKLEARVITAASIPRTLIQRLAELLQTSVEAILAYLASARPPAQGAQLYLAERPPAEYPQQSFLDAVEHSTLSEDEKRAWIEIARRDGVA